MKEASDSAKRILCVAALLSACVLAGCQSTWPQAKWPQTAASFVPDTKDAAAEKSAGDTTTEPETQTANVETDRVDQAREDVLAFIHRLDQIEQAKTPAVATQEPRPAERPAAESRVRTARVAEQDAQPASQVAMRTPVTPPVKTASPPRIVRVSVRADQDRTQPPARGSQPKVVSIDATSVANVPIDVRSASSEEAKLDAVIERLAAYSANAPNDLKAQWRLAFLRLADGEGASDAARSVGMLEGPATLLASAVRAMDATRTAMEDPTGAIGDALAAVDTLRQELRARAELSVPTVALCSRVQAFGIFDPLPDDTFRPGVQNQAIVYFSVANFSSEQAPEGRMRTLLNSQLEILTANGDVAWEFEESRVEDFCVEQREDFFVAQRILLPARLQEGAYVLKVTVEDVLANKRTQALHPFNIGTPKSKFPN